MSKTVIDMAREIWSAGDVYIGPSEKTLELFANLVRADAIAAEREACATECEGINSAKDYYGERPELVCAEAIRARSNT